MKSNKLHKLFKYWNMRWQDKAPIDFLTKPSIFPLLSSKWLKIASTWYGILMSCNWNLRNTFISYPDKPVLSPSVGFDISSSWNSTEYLFMFFLCPFFPFSGCSIYLMFHLHFKDNTFIVWFCFVVYCLSCRYFCWYKLS